MSIFKPVNFYKENVLPTGNRLMPNSLYFIKVGEEFDLYVTTDTTPAVAKRIVPGSAPVSSGHIILWDDVEVTPRSKLNFRGFVVSDNGELDATEVEFNPANILDDIPEDSDTLLIYRQEEDDSDDDDSSEEPGWFKFTWSKLKEWLKTYFDTLYSVKGHVHPAKSILVDEAPVPDYTTPALNNTLQDITNKVAGLQENIIAEYTFTEDFTDAEFSLTGFTINENQPFMISLIMNNVSTDDTTYNIYFRINNITNGVYYNSTSLSSVWSVSSGAEFSAHTFMMNFINKRVHGRYISNYRRSGLAAVQVGNMYINEEINSVTSIQILRFTTPKIPAGSKLVITRI